MPCESHDHEMSNKLTTFHPHMDRLEFPVQTINASVLCINQTVGYKLTKSMNHLKKGNMDDTIRLRQNVCHTGKIFIGRDQSIFVRAFHKLSYFISMEAKRRSERYNKDK